MDHLMIDLETLATTPRATVLSLGVVAFDSKQILGELYLEFDIEEQFRLRRDISPMTIAWWMDQTKEAQAVFSADNKVSAVEGLTSFGNFIEAHVDPSTARVWANGAGFDLPIVQSLMHDLQMQVPWRFYNERCMRTIKMQLPDLKVKLDRGVAHNALDDARHQARFMQMVMECNPLLR